MSASPPPPSPPVPRPPGTPRRGHSLHWIVAVVVLVVLFIVLSSRRDEQPQTSPTPPAPIPTAAAAPAATVTPTETPTPEPTPTPAVETSTVTVPWHEEATPTPTPTEEPVAARRPEDAGSCVSARWRVYNSPTVFGEIHVEITASSRCTRTLEPLEVWFRVSTFQKGTLIMTRDGHPFDRLEPGREVTAVIAVPGDLSIYDQVDVEVTAPRGPTGDAR